MFVFIFIFNFANKIVNNISINRVEGFYINIEHDFVYTLVLVFNIKLVFRQFLLVEDLGDAV